MTLKKLFLQPFPHPTQRNNFSSFYSHPIGGLLYTFGLIVNLDSDHRLRQLRKNDPTETTSEMEISGSDKKQTRYSIPRGGLFELVSSANYFGEICEWWGFAIAANFNASSVWFAAFTTIFLGWRGVDNHR